MQQVYGVGPEISSAGFAVAAALGLTLYAPAGRWSERFGSLRVLQVALGVRVLAFLGLFALGMTHFESQGALALLGFLFVVLAWSLLSVTGTALAAQFSPVGEGEGMGVFSAITALAPATVQRMPDCLRRWPITVLQPASTTPEPTKKPRARYCQTPRTPCATRS